MSQEQEDHITQDLEFKNTQSKVKSALQKLLETRSLKNKLKHDSKDEELIEIGDDDTEGLDLSSDKLNDYLLEFQDGLADDEHNSLMDMESYDDNFLESGYINDDSLLDMENGLEDEDLIETTDIANDEEDILIQSQEVNCKKNPKAPEQQKLLYPDDEKDQENSNDPKCIDQLLDLQEEVDCEKYPNDPECLDQLQEAEAIYCDPDEHDVDKLFEIDGSEECDSNDPECKQHSELFGINDKENLGDENFESLTQLADIIQIKQIYDISSIIFVK